MRWSWSSRWSTAAHYSWITGRDLDPNRHIRRLPPQQGGWSLRHDSGHRWWLEGVAMAMGPQHRLSGGDLDDERIGASRSRTDIANFFASTRVVALRDGDGETLAQVRDRVLGAGLAAGIRVPMFTHTAGWLRLDVRGGRSIGEHWQLMVAAENLMDRHLSRPRLRHGCGGRKCLCQPAFPLVGAGRARAQ